LKRLFYLTVLITFSIAALAQSRTITGVVMNGTTNKPATGDDVILIKLAQGMEEEARTKTGSHGEFKLTMTDGSELHLVRVRHDNVNYHEPAPPNVRNLQITVYNAASNPPGIKLLDQSEVYQSSNATQLEVIALFRVTNPAIPPLTQPSLEIYLPEGASVKACQAVMGSGMQVKVTVVPQKENRYTLLYPLRPGNTQLELAYTLPYSGTASMRPKLTMNADHFYVVTAKGIRFSSAAGVPFHAAADWPTDPSITGIEVHAAEDVSPAKQISFGLSGAGVLPEQQPAPAQGAQGAPQPQEDNRPGGGLGEPNEKPDPLHSGQWLFLGVLSLFLAAGATYVYTSNQSPPERAGKPKVGRSLLLEAMKEEIFQLETDRLQGKISPQEYESAKAALDKTLQRAVQRQKEK
jgi:hypothetical protein